MSSHTKIKTIWLPSIRWDPSIEQNNMYHSILGVMKYAIHYNPPPPQKGVYCTIYDECTAAQRENIDGRISNIED